MEKPMDDLENKKVIFNVKDENREVNLDKIKEYFKPYKKVAVGFSSGVDSSLVLKLASLYCEKVKGYYIKSQFQPLFEFNDAKKLQKDINADVEYINVDILREEEVRNNPKNRCYFCKKVIFSTILNEAKKDGFSILFDGTNFSDSYDDRPGMKALKELKVISPLRQMGLTKDDVRKLSKKLNLFTHDKISYSCLATRVKTNQVINENILFKVEEAEKILFDLGFTDFRVRVFENNCKIEIKDSDFLKLIECRPVIIDKLSEFFDDVLLNLRGR